MTVVAQPIEFEEHEAHVCQGNSLTRPFYENSAILSESAFAPDGNQQQSWVSR